MRSFLCSLNSVQQVGIWLLKQIWEKPMIGWNGTLQFFTDLSFREKLVNWIMQCIITTTLTIIMYEKPGDNFQPKRGIQQDDPISPIIIIICAKYLGRYTISCQYRNFIGIKVAIDYQDSIFMFTDVCLIFYRASKKGVETLGHIGSLLQSFRTTS